MMMETTMETTKKTTMKTREHAYPETWWPEDNGMKVRDTMRLVALWGLVIGNTTFEWDEDTLLGEQGIMVGDEWKMATR